MLVSFASPFRVLPFDSEDAEIFGSLRAYLERAGTPIGPYDLQIAAQVIRHNCVLVTNNVREFERIPGLNIENWVT
jgi:tRNA(fMet)-specific endonuclease VapC